MSTKSKLLLTIILIFISLNISFCFEEPKFLQNSSEDMISQNLNSLRYLEPSDENLVAKIYLKYDYQGEFYEVIGSHIRHFRKSKISLLVGKETTLRIIDNENKWVYRFAPNEKVSEFNLKSKDWYATLEKPQSDQNCVMVFENENYSGYFEEICLEGNHWVTGQLFDRKYTSFTFPHGTRIKYAGFLGKEGDFQLFHFRSAFSCDLNYIYVFADIPDEEAYAFPAKTLAFFGITTDSTGEPTQLEAGPYLFVNGEDSFAQITGSHTLVTLSRDRQFVYKVINQNTVARARSLQENLNNYCVATYEDEDGLINRNHGCYPGTTFNDHIGYIIFPRNGILGAFLQYEDDSVIEMRDTGRTPQFFNNKIKLTILVPVPSSVDRFGDLTVLENWNQSATVYNNQYFVTPINSTPNLLLHGVNYNDLIKSMIVGNQNDLYLITDLKTNQVLYYPRGSFVSLETGIRNILPLFDRQEVFDKIITPSCVRLYNTCDIKNFDEFQEICVSSPELFEKVNLLNVKYIAIPKSFNGYSSVLVYQEDCLDGQFDLTKSFCITKPLNKNLKITLLPVVEDNHLIVYSDYFYRGTSKILDSRIEEIATLNENNDKISIIFGRGAKAKVINLTERKVLDLDYNVPKFKAQGMEIYVQSVKDEIINKVDSCLWTFDNNDYKDFRRLCGGHFYSESSVSYKANYMVFPKDTIDIVILVDRRNSIIQTYKREDLTNYLNPIDHTSFGGVERMITLDNNWDKVLFARYEDFGEFKAIISDSVNMNLKHTQHYSFVNSLKRHLTLYNWALLDNLKYNPQDAIRVVKKEQFILRDFTVGLTGLYGFVLGDENPISVLPDCVLIFDGCGNPTNTIRRFCMRSRGIGTDLFNIYVGKGVGHINIILTTENLDIKRKYAVFKFNGQILHESKCVEVNEDTNYVGKFFPSKN